MAGALRNQIIYGSKYLLIRRAIGFVVTFGGMLVLTHLIGVRNYGMFATITSITLFITEICSQGISIYLIRENESKNKDMYDLAFTIMLCATLTAVAVGIGISFPLKTWLHNPEIQLPFILGLLGIPLNAVLVPALAKLETNLQFRQVALMEMAAQIFYYGLAIGLALLGFGIWAPVLGNMIQGMTAILLGCALSGYRPSLYWSSEKFRRMIKYVTSYSLTTRVLGLRQLINPLLVGRFVGAEGVAILAMSMKLLEALSIVNGTIERVSFALFSKIQSEKNRVESAMNELMRLQILSLVPFLVLFSISGPTIIPFVFGKDWSEILQVFPYLSLSFLASRLFSVHAHVLYVQDNNWSVLRFAAVHIFILGLTAGLLIPSMGLNGYVIAEMAAISSCVLLHVSISNLYRIQYRQPLFYVAVCVPSLFYAMVPVPWALLLLLPTVAFLAFAAPRNQMLGYWRQLRKTKSLDVA